MYAGGQRLGGRIMRLELRLGVSLLALTAAVSAHAQEPENGTEATRQAPARGATVLEAVTVTGSRAPQQISETARTIHVVQGEDIQARARAGENLQQILAQEIPSFDAASFGARTSDRKSVV